MAPDVLNSMTKTGHIPSIIAFFLFVIVLFVFLICMLWIIFSLIQSALGDSPFIPVMDHALAPIVSQLHLEPSSVFVDIGCGNGKVLVAASKQFPLATMIGIERDIVPYLLARFNTRTLKNVSIVRKNIFDYDFSKVTHAYAYLLPNVMDKMHDKLVREFRSGTILVSCDFSFNKKQADQTIFIAPDRKLFIAKKLFVYHF